MHNSQIRHTIVFWVTILMVNVLIVALTYGSLFDHQTAHLVS